MKTLFRNNPIIFAVGLGLIAIAGGSIGRSIADRDQPTVILHVDALDPQVRPGATLRVAMHVRRFRTDCSISSQRIIIDAMHTRYLLLDRDFVASPGPTGDETFVVPTVVPADIALGTAHYHTVTLYACNFVHRYLWPLPAEESDVTFEVIGRQ